MWGTVFTNSAERIESSRERDDILRQLGRYCPLEDVAVVLAEVWRTPVIGWAEMQLVRIVTDVSVSRPKVIYGLFAQGDFRPLDRNGEVLRFAYKVDEPLSQNKLNVDELVASWVAHIGQPDHEDVLFPDRIQAALPMWEWHHRNEFGSKVTHVLDQMELLVKGDEERSSPARLKDAVLRFAELPFYANWRLLEYAGYDNEGKLCRTYALCKEDVEQMAILPLDGRSGPIHTANGARGELLLDTPEQRAAYLRFFCWAIESKEGNFLLPRHRRELDLTDRPDERVLDLLKPDMFIEELDEEADEEAGQRGYASIGDDRRFGRLKAPVVYGTALFQAWFKLERNGEVVMVDDSSLADDLPLNLERFGDPRLPILRWPQPVKPAEKTAEVAEKTTDQGPAVRFYGHHFTDERSPRTMSAPSFLEELQSGGSTGGEVVDAVRLVLDPTMLNGARRLLIADTHFRALVDLTGLGAGMSLHFKNCLFDQGIQGHLAELDGDLVLENCSFGLLPTTQTCACSIDLSDARIKGKLHLLDCHLTYAFFADRILVESDMLIWGSFFGGQLSKREPHWRVQELLYTEGEMLANGQALMLPDRATGLFDGTDFYLSNAVIHGDMEVTVLDNDQRLRESIRWRNLTWGSAMVCNVIRGALVAHGCEVHHNMAMGGSIWAGHVDLSSAHCHGSLNGSIIAYDDPRKKHRIIGLRVWNSDLKLANARFDADLLLHGTDVLADEEHPGFGELDLRSTTIGGRLDLAGARIAADLDLDFCEVGDYVNAYFTNGWFSDQRLGLHVGKDLSLSGAKMNSVELRGVRVGRMVRAMTGSFGRMLISMGVTPYGKDEKALIPVASHIGALEFRSVVIHGDLHLIGIRVAPEKLNQAALRRSQSNCGIKVAGCSIGGDLLFFEEELKVALERRWGAGFENRPPWVNPGSSDTDRDAGDDTSGGLKNEPFRPGLLQAQTWGHLDLSSTTVGGHLDLRNIFVGSEFILNDLSVKLDLRLDHGQNWKEKGVDDWNEPPRSIGSSMSAEKLRCDGDVRMTGLTLGSKDLLQTDPVLKAREAQVRGEWLFMPLNHGAQPRARVPDKNTIALLHGGLDLAAAQINHLILGKENFDLAAEGGPDDQGSPPKVVDLERATINRFEIVKPMPSTVDLSRIKVGRWEFNAGTATADDYLEVLKEMNPFDRSVWVDVERSLRNEARDDDAHKVYRGMRREAARRRNLSSGRLRSGLKSAVINILQALLWPLLIPFSLVVIVLLWVAALLSVAMNKVRLSSTPARLQFVEGCRSAIDRTFSRMERWVTAYGTQVWRPMILWFIFLGFSLWLLSDPANVELELGPRVVLVQDGRIVSSDPLHGIALSVEEHPESRTQGPSPYPALLQLRRDQLAAGSSWSLSDALFLTMRYHIPVLDMGIQSEWKAGQREMALGPLQFTPEKWAAAAQGYSFIAWSLLLIGLSVQVFRGKQG